MGKIRLKYPFTWEERKPFIEDKVLFVPQYYFAHDQYSMPQFSEVFGNNNPCFLELCSGNGDWVLSRAQNNPNQNWIAVEKDFDRVRKIYSKRAQAQTTNLMIVSGEAEPFVKHYLSPQSIEKTYINFPDPWPKDRHAKHRLMKNPFIYDMAGKLKPKATLTFVSDDFPYIEETRAHLEDSSAWNLIDVSVLPENSQYGSSWFEELWREKGKTIYRIEAEPKHE